MICQKHARQWLSFALSALILPHAARADINNVPADQPSIQAAIVAATDGDEIVVAQAQTTQTTYHYYNFKQERPLALDVDRIAIFRSHREDGDSLVNGLLQYGIGSGAAERWTVPDWWMVEVPQLSRHPEGIEGLLAAVKNDAGIDFVSPVFIGTDGGPLIITPDILVCFQSSVSSERAEAILQASAAGEITDRNWAGMPGAYRLRNNSKDGLAVLDAANSLAEKSEVMFAEPDVMFTGRGLSIPNDPGFPLCWGLHNTGQSGGTPDMDMDGPEAWDVTMGDSAIMVLIIDTGVQQDHPDINQIPGVDTTSQGPSDGGPVNDCDNHGTPVAGCVSAIINNNLGTVGIAPNCKSASARAFISNPQCDGDWSSTASWTVESLAWAQSNGVRVTSNSNMYGFTSSAIELKYGQTRQAGMVHFACAGNDGGGSIAYPANIASVNAVTALNRNGNLAGFATTGPGLAFTAPGVSIYTTDRTGPDGWTGGDYTFASGCSFATPYTSGVAALLLSENPGADAASVESVLKASSVDLGLPGYDISFGWGFVNAQAALELCIPVLDCNGNGFDDSCDIFSGLSHDCNGNGAPDECEPDADGDSVPDDCDNCELPNPNQRDCQPNGVGDVCDLAEEISQDCNGNTVPDECDISGNTSDDCQPNGTPDECELDTDGDSIPDDCDNCELPNPNQRDCQPNGVGDVCDFAAEISQDCNGNTVPDECDISGNTSDDCQPNKIPDECDLVFGDSEDCNENNMPDECEVGIGPTILAQPESQEVEEGTDFALFSVQAEALVPAYQWHKNGELLVGGEDFAFLDATLFVVDVQPEDAGNYDCLVTDLVTSCSTLSDAATLTVLQSTCPADLDGDGQVRVSDLIILLAAWGPNPGHPADFDGDGEVRVPDLIILLGAWGLCI